jgi:DNA-binding response OmpR family regulator
VVEDEVEILNLIEVFLGKEGYRVVKANSKRAADIALSKSILDCPMVMALSLSRKSEQAQKVG